MNWENKKVLITGAGGFIGSHLTEKLVTLGAATRALVHYKSEMSEGWLRQSKYRKDIELYVGDVRDRESIVQSFAGIDTVFHLAALIAIPYSYSSPISYVRTNIEGSLNVFEASRNADIRMLVHTSSSEVYGTAKYVPIDETHSLQGQSPYAASKISADKLAEAYHLSFGLPVATIRPFNTYGPRQSSRAVIPTIISQALNESNITLGNLTPTRDFNFVSDTVDAFIAVGSNSDAVGEVINTGTGEEISINDLVHVILGLVGKPNLDIQPDTNRMRPKMSEVDRLCADNGKAAELLDWRSQYTLKQGISETIDWISNHPEYYRSEEYGV